MKKGNLRDLVMKERYDGYVKNVPFDADDLGCLGTKFQVVTFRPGEAIKPHYHKKTTEIFYVREGNGVLKLNDEEHRCQPDDFFLCQPGDVHEFINDTQNNYTILIFKIMKKKEICIGFKN